MTTSLRDLSREVTGYNPVDLVATITETKDATRTLLFIADVLDQSKKELTEEISSRLSPVEREKRQDQDQAAHETARSAFEQAKLAYLLALAEWEKAAGKTGTDRAIADQKLEIARQAYNRARRDVGLPPVL